MEVPEYDMAAFDPAAMRWSSHLPTSMEKQWSWRLPLAYVPRTYSGITTGSERSIMRGITEDRPGVPRPDLNIVFDQVAYRTVNDSLYYFTGGVTRAHDSPQRHCRALTPTQSPPRVPGGGPAYH